MINFYSIVFGSLTAAVPHFVFYKMLMKQQDAIHANIIVSNFYKGEAVKIVMTIILMLISFNLQYVVHWLAIVPIHYIVTYIITTILQSIAWIVYRNKRRG